MCLLKLPILKHGYYIQLCFTCKILVCFQTPGHNYTYISRFAKMYIFSNNFNVHFWQPPDWYNNTITVHVYTVAKFQQSAFMEVSFFSLLTSECVQVSINGSIFPGQADSQQEITTRLACETKHLFSNILWYLD